MLCDDDKVRVLFVVHSSGMAGAERVFLHLVKGLDRSKFLPVVVFPGKGHLVDEVKMLGIRTHIVPMKWWLAGDNKLPRLVVRAMAEILSVAAIVRMIRRFSPAVVYSSSAAIFSGAIAARLARKPHVWRVAEILPGNPDHRFFAGVANALRLIVHFSHRIVVPSKAVAEQFGRFSAGMLPPIDVVPPPADPSFVKGTGASRDLAGSDWRRRQGLAESDYLLCNVGTLCARKAQDDSIRVLALLKKSVPQSKLVLAGGGRMRYRQYLQSLARDLGVENDVLMVGQVEDVASVIAASDVVISTAPQEPFGLCFLEAMAMSKPVVSFASGGPVEIVVDGKTGFLVPRGDIGAMVSKLAMLSSDTQLRKAFGMAGRQCVEDRYSIRSHIAKMERILLAAAEIKFVPRRCPASTEE